MTSTAKISFAYKADLISSDFNKRFADFFGNSIIKGYRFTTSEKAFYVSLVKDIDDTNLLITRGGVRVEDEDKIDAIYIQPNAHATNTRIDTVYLIHIEGMEIISYVVISGDPETGEVAPLKTEPTHTLLGYVTVPPNYGTLLQEHLKPIHLGLSSLEVEGDAYFHSDLYVEGNINLAGEVKVTGAVHRGSYATTSKGGFMSAADKRRLRTLEDQVKQLMSVIESQQQTNSPE